MPNRFYSPEQQFISNTGVPYTGGQLFFYATGTSTPLNTYSDAALTIPNTNPVVLDANGQAGSVFLQNLSYKVVLEDVNNNQIWTMDPVYTSDYSTFAKFQPFNGNPNGQVAGTAGTVGSLPGTSVVWDYTDSLLYVCTTSGNAASAVWTATNASAATPATPAPQGYLTLNSDPANPILTTDSVSSTTVFYTPYAGNLVPVFNGASMITTSFTQLSLTLSASQASNTVYDVFVFSNSGVLTLVNGPAWSNSTAGASARGSGAGTTQLQRLSGLWVNAVQISGRNGGNTYTIPANVATYLGSIYTDNVAGQVTCHRTYGQNRKWGVWNAYNRTPIMLMAGDGTPNWTYNTNTTRASNNTPPSYTANFFNFGSGTACNGGVIFTALPEEEVDLRFVQVVTLSSNNSPATANVRIGINSTTGGVGKGGTAQFATALAAPLSNINDLVAEHVLAPTLGLTNFVSQETTPNAGLGVNYTGTNASMLLSAYYRG